MPELKRWVPVTERMPPEGKGVLVYHEPTALRGAGLAMVQRDGGRVHGGLAERRPR